jgi:hypothetical protein
MIHGGPGPGIGSGAVTAFTIGGIPGLLMIGILGGIVVFQVAIAALGR